MSADERTALIQQCAEAAVVAFSSVTPLQFALDQRAAAKKIYDAILAQAKP